MNAAQQFITAIENYYGPYPRPAVKSAAFKYANNKSKEFLQGLYGLIVANVSCQYNYVPDVAKFKELAKLLPVKPKLFLPEPLLTDVELAEVEVFLKQLREKFPAEDSGTNAGSYIGGILADQESKIKMEQAKRELRLVKIEKAAG